MRKNPFPTFQQRLISALLGMLVLLSACSNTADPTEPNEQLPTIPSPPTTTSLSSSEQSNEPITITFTADEFERQAYEPLIERFNAENPDIRVQFVPLQMTGTIISAEAITRQIVTTADTGVAPFLFQSDIDRGLYYNLTPLIDADPSFDRDDYYTSAFSHDDIFMLPSNLWLSMINYNRTLWEQQGLATPSPDWTWSDVLATAQQLTQKRGNTIDVYGMIDGRNGLNALLGLLREQGFDLESTSPDQVRLDTPEVERALEQVVESIESGALWHTTESSPQFEEQFNLVQNQQVGMWVDLPLIISTSQEEQTQPGYAMLPAGESVHLGRGFVMSSGTTHPEAAWRWLSFLSRQNTDRGYTISGVQEVPARKSLAASSAVWQQFDATTRTNIETALNTKLKKLPEGVSSDTLVNNLLSSALTDILTGKQTVAQALSAAQADFEQQSLEAMNKPTPTPDPAPIVVATPAPSGPAPGATTVVFRGLPFQNERLRPLAQRFQEQHPEWFIDLQSVAIGPNTPLSAATLADNADCFVWFDASPITMTLDLRPLFDADSTFSLDDYPSSVIAPFQNGTGIYGLPFHITLQALSYNQDAFDAVGLSYPNKDWMIHDLINAAEQLSDLTESDPRYGYAVMGSHTDDLLQFLDQFDAAPTQDRQLRFTDDKVINAVRTYLDFLKNYTPHTKLQGYTTEFTFGGEVMQLIEEGRVGMWTDLPGSVRIVMIGEEGRRGFTRALTAPPGAGRRTPDRLNVTGLFISNTSQQPEGCWEWFKFLSEDVSILDNAFPARRSIAQSSAFANNAPPGAADVYAGYLPALERQPSTQGNQQSRINLYWFFQAVDRALQGEDLERELDQAQRKTEEYLLCIDSGGNAPDCAVQVDPQYQGR